MRDRFFNKVNKTDSCWNWVGATRNGYGAFKLNGKVIQSHRLSFNIYYGDIPDGLFVCHKCDNKKCVNPDHLFLGTAKDNMLDCVSKNRNYVNYEGNFKRGHYPKNAKLNLEDALIVKYKIAHRGDKTLKLLSEELNVSYTFVRDISCGRILKQYLV